MVHSSEGGFSKKWCDGEREVEGGACAKWQTVFLMRENGVLFKREGGVFFMREGGVLFKREGGVLYKSEGDLSV